MMRHKSLSDRENREKFMTRKPNSVACFILFMMHVMVVEQSINKPNE